ncbi:hypothetical protein LINPERHAP1_LOCUS13176, partial [Linum perenne]
CCVGLETVHPFLLTELHDWLGQIISHDNSLLLGIACWYLWKARNELIFAGSHQHPFELGQRNLNWKMVVQSAMATERNSLVSEHVRIRTEICWEPGESNPDAVTLNIDGSVDPRTGQASAGGLIRNHMGCCSRAFTVNLGCCSITRAKL